MPRIDAPVSMDLTLEVNGASRALRIDTRTTLLDALRECGIAQRRALEMQRHLVRRKGRVALDQA